MPELVLGDQPKSAEKPRAKRTRGGMKRIIIFAVIIAAVILLISLINKATNDEIAIFETDAVFISTKDNDTTKYALYKKNGDKVTEFSFSQVSQFVNGYAYVKNLDGEKGIIDHDGKMTVEFGEYDDIMPRVGIYEATKDNKETLILGNGNELASEYRGYDYSSNAPYAVVEYEDNQYKLYNALGKKLADFETDEMPNFSDDASETASALSYKGGLIILDNKNFEPIKTINTGTLYDIDKSNEDATILTFAEHGKHRDKDAKRALFNKEFTEFGDQCKDLELHDGFTDEHRIYVTCEKDDKSYLVRQNAITDIEVNSYGTGYVVYDEDHYARYDSDDKKVDIFVKGEVKNTLDSDYRMTISAKGYVINDYRAKTVTLYDIDGNEFYSLKEASSLSELVGIDKNDNIIVRDNKQDNNKRYVIVDKDGKEISGRYRSIAAHDGYYTAYKKDDEIDLLDKNGDVVISGEYSELTYYDDGKIILGKKGDYSDRQYDLFDIDGKKVKASFDGTTTYYKADYFRVVKDKKVTYYTLDGKEMYSYEDK